MQSWYCPPVPVLPGRGPQLRLYDSADRQVRPVAPGSKATMYVCGITPYDATHLGHAATYVTFDLIHRLWLDLGHELHYVQNITDIDDPLFERADRDGVDWRDLAQAEVALFCEDMAALRVLPPQDYVGATEAIAEMVELIEKMLACGAAYVIDREMGEYQDIYFRADATLQFGYESGYDRDTMLRLCEERGGDPRRPGKSDELDALLWRAARPGEPSWPSPFGPGRPGWHVECAAIALSRIGSGLDIQGGGSDLIFPHHEFTAAHAECVSGERRFARHYVHAGMIGWVCSPDTTEPIGSGASRCLTRRPPGCTVGAPQPHFPPVRPQLTLSLGCAATWPTISIRPKRLPHWMVGSPMRWSTAATMPGRRSWWRRRSMPCSGWTCSRRGGTFSAMTSLQGKVVFITGAARGIGAEVARRLHNKGAKLVLTDLSKSELAVMGAELGGDDRLLTVVADVRDLPAMQAAAETAVERFGGIDVVVANAGIASYGSVLKVDPQAFRRVLDVNLLGNFHTVRATLPALIDRRGYVLIVSSLAAFAAPPGMAPYNMSKAGNEHFANALRLEVAHLGVSVGSAHMSWIDTALVRDTKADLPAFAELLARLPWPLNKTTSVNKCAAAFVNGIEGRKDRVYCPGWVALFRWLKPLLSTRVGQRPIRNTVAKLMPQMDAEVAALGRFASAYTESLENS